MMGVLFEVPSHNSSVITFEPFRCQNKHAKFQGLIIIQ